MIDVLLLAFMGVVVWMTANDGPWSAAITFVSVLISGLVAMNFYEPLANFLGSNVLTTYDWKHRVDIIALLGLFSAGIFGLRALSEALLPTYAELDGLVYQGARWVFGVLAGYTVMAIVCVSLHVAPLPREFLGFSAERGNVVGLAPDRQWLAFTQYVSEHSLQRRRYDGRPVLFDGAVFPANPDDKESTVTWSDFPIKYAARRQRFASGAAAAAAPSTTPPSPVTPPTPRANPTGGTGGF